MPATLKRSLFILGGIVGVLAVLALVVPRFVDLDRHKPALEAGARDFLGMDVELRGRLGLGLFPDVHVSAEDGHILADDGASLASARRVRVGIRLLPLLRRQIRLRRVELTEPRLAIERDSLGRSNAGRILAKAPTLIAALDGTRLSLANGTFRYTDARNGTVTEASGFHLAVSRLRLPPGGRSPALAGVSIRAEFSCAELRTKNLVLTALKISAEGRDGVLDLDPVAMRIFGGQLTGDVRADLTGPEPRVRLRCALPQFRIEEFLATLSPEEAAAGTMDFSAELSAQGAAPAPLVATLAGDLSLRGQDLELQGHDLDREISRFESSQSFNLVDVGAVFFAGPLGLAVTKGYNFATLFRGSGGRSRIGTLVSDWTVENGVARAKDVAMATGDHRLALQGGLDFVNARFADVTVAVIDDAGCATVRQAMSGDFANPVVEKPHFLTSLAGPVLKLYRQTRGLLPGGPCEVFYSGSVAAPK